MVRNFLMWQDGNEWEIRESGLEVYQDAQNLDIDAFAISKQRDNKIVYLMDIGFKDEEIEIIKEMEVFKEICNFTYNETCFIQNKIQPDGYSFTANFIEALEFLKKKFDEDYDKSFEQKLSLYENQKD